MKGLSILGSTGSIGTNVLRVVDAFPGLEVVGLAAGGNVEALAEQVGRHRPKVVSVGDRAGLERLSRLVDGMFLFTQGEYMSSIREWEIARQIDPTNCDLLVNLGQAYEMTGDLEKAKALYLEAYALNANEHLECHKEATKRVNESPSIMEKDIWNLFQ